MPETIDRKVRYLLLNGLGSDNDKIGVLEIMIIIIFTIILRMTPLATWLLVAGPGCEVTADTGHEPSH